jgi:hypothetical protein
MMVDAKDEMQKLDASVEAKRAPPTGRRLKYNLYDLISHKTFAIHRELPKGQDTDTIQD